VVALKETHAEIVEALQSGRYAFLDAGCGEGGSMTQLSQRFGRSPGLGIDYYPEAIEASRISGFEVMYSNLLMPDLVLPEGCVDYAAAMDFLEHLPTEQDAVQVLVKLASAARDFLVIRHPSFEDVEYLKQFGLKLNWTDWSCHPNPMKLGDFHRIFAGLGWHDYEILPHMNYTDSSHESMLPLTAPTDTLRYDPKSHGPKPQVEFDRKVWGKFDIFVKLNPAMDEAAWESIARVDGWEAHWDF
jgi:Methyltransferase domain